MQTAGATMIAGIAILTLLSAGCGRETPRSEPTTVDSRVPSEHSASAGTGEVADSAVPPAPTATYQVEPGTGKTLLDQVVLGHPAGESVEEAEAFGTGEPIRVLVRVTEVPSHLAAWVDWIGPEDQLIVRQQKAVPPSKQISFTLADSPDRKPGNYRAEIYIGGDLATTKVFTVGNGSGTPRNGSEPAGH